MMEDGEAAGEIRLPDDISPKSLDALTGKTTRMQSIHWSNPPV